MASSGPFPETVSILDYSADPTGIQSSTHALQQALDAADGDRPLRVIVPAGTFLTGLLHLRSNTELHLSADSVLKSSPHYEDHAFEGKRGGMLLARNVENVSLTGPGIIDGAEEVWFDFQDSHSYVDYDLSAIHQGRGFIDFPTPFRDGPVRPRPRPGNLLIFSNCRNVRLADFTVRGSSYWTVHLGDCTHLVAENLIIENDPRCPNNDGIHLSSCRHAVLRDLRIRAGDDAIALTGFRNLENEPEIELGFQNLEGELTDILVENCTLFSRSSAIRIGYGSNEMSDLRIRQVRVADSNRGIALQVRDAGSIRDVLLEDITIQTRYMAGSWWGNGEPISITAARRFRETAPGSIRNIRMRRIGMIGPSPVLLYADGSSRIANIEFEECRHQLCADPLFGQRGQTIDLRPIHDHRRALENIGKCALYSRGIENLKLSHSQFLNEDGETAVDRGSG